MSSRRKQFEQKLGTSLFRWAQRAFSKRSHEQAEKLGNRLGNLFWKLSKKHRERALSNLALALPEIPEPQREQIARETFRHFARIAGDFLRSKKIDPQELIANVEVNGWEHFEEAWAEQKGIMLVTAHYGNWERMAHYMTARGYPLTVVARDANDASMNETVNDLRRANGVEVLSRGNAARAILDALKRKRLVAILPDQNSGDSFLPFFGKPCGTALGPAVLHLRTSAPLLPVFATDLGAGRYRFEIMPAIRGEGKGDSPERIMTLINEVLEAGIRKHPEQWLWFHDRWKSARKRGLI